MLCLDREAQRGSIIRFPRCELSTDLNAQAAVGGPPARLSLSILSLQARWILDPQPPPFIRGKPSAHFEQIDRLGQGHSEHKLLKFCMD
jgi:hypothetical protein